MMAQTKVIAQLSPVHQLEAGDHVSNGYKHAIVVQVGNSFATTLLVHVAQCLVAQSTYEKFFSNSEVFIVSYGENWWNRLKLDHVNSQMPLHPNEVVQRARALVTKPVPRQLREAPESFTTWCKCNFPEFSKSGIWPLSEPVLDYQNLPAGTLVTLQARIDGKEIPLVVSDRKLCYDQSVHFGDVFRVVKTSGSSPVFGLMHNISGRLLFSAPLGQKFIHGSSGGGEVYCRYKLFGSGEQLVIDSRNRIRFWKTNRYWKCSSSSSQLLHVTERRSEALSISIVTHNA
jgi:hypothetical protein